jgi:hypothetical protein
MISSDRLLRNHSQALNLSIVPEGHAQQVPSLVSGLPSLAGRVSSEEDSSSKLVFVVQHS